MKLLVALATALLAPTLHAASFNCAKASSKVEKAICASPAMGRLDDDIAAAYTAARADLDDKWRPRLLRSQREWLAQRTASAELPADLRGRLAILRGLHVTLRGVRFLKLTDEARPMYVLDDVPGAAAYNQWVDSVWNDAVGQTSKLREGDDRCASSEEPDCVSDSTARTYTTTVPSPALLSVGETIINYQQGAAHPDVEFTDQNWWLARSGRVTTKDIFTGAAWKPVFAKAVRAWVRTDNDRLEVDDAAIDSVATMDAWKLTPAALVVSLDGYTFHLGRGIVEVEIPWSSFGASLRPAFAAALGRH
jgi:uncharacterized protein YecT (DUF1311 family)